MRMGLLNSKPVLFHNVTSTIANCTKWWFSEVARRRARLVLGWAAVSACNQTPRSTQPGYPSVSRRSECRRTAVLTSHWPCVIDNGLWAHGLRKEDEQCACIFFRRYGTLNPTEPRHFKTVTAPNSTVWNFTGDRPWANSDPGVIKLQLIYAMVTTFTIRLRFDGCSTAVRRPFDCSSKVIKATVT